MLNSVIEKVGGRFTSRARYFATQDRFARAGISDPTKIGSYTTRAELNALMDLALVVPDNGVILEIGSHRGASSCYLAAGGFGRGITLYCVDTWDNRNMPDGPQDIFQQFQKNLGRAFSMVRPIRKANSELLASDIRTPIDLAFLDADHSYFSTRSDFRRVNPWMSPKGIIAFHDSQSFEGVSRVIGEVLATGTWQIAGHLRNLTWLERPEWIATDRTPSPGDITAV